MVKKSRRWGGPRPAPYNPNARDADNDGMVQEGTIWERPGGARFVNRLGQEIAAAAAAVTPGSYIVNDRGERIDYTPSWQRDGVPGDVDLSPAGGLPRLGDIGMPSIGETNGTIRDTMGTVEGPPEIPDLKPDPRDVDAPDVDRVSLPDGRQEAFEAEISTLSGQEIRERRQRLAKELTEGALQGSNWNRTDGRATGNGTRPEFAVEPIATFQLDEAAEERIEELGGTAFPIHELPSDAAGAETFRDAVKYAHDTHKFGTSVSVYDAKDYEGLRLFVSPEGTSGFAVTPDGELVSVFNADDKVEMPLHTMIPLAISQGATRADAFDTVLPGFYAQFGLQPTARIPFSDDPDVIPTGWDPNLYRKFNDGKPDVVFMRFDPDRIGESYVPGDGVYVEDYDAGLASTADPPAIDVYPEEVSGKEGVYDAVNSLVEGQPDPEAGWVFTGSKEVIDSHGEAAEEAITSYVRNSIPINTDLRDGDISPENQETIDMFDELFEALPESEGGTVYRGAAMRTLLGDVEVESEEGLDDLIEATIGATITDDGILSTSTRPEVAVDFSKANRVDGEPEGYLVLEFDIPEGGKALGISNYPGRGESEVLLPRSSEYEVVSVQKIRKADGDHPTYVVKVAQKPPGSAVDSEVSAQGAVQVIEGEGRKGLADSLRETSEDFPPFTEVLTNRSVTREWSGSPTGDAWKATQKYARSPEGINNKLRDGNLSPEDQEFADQLTEAIEGAHTGKAHTVFRALPASGLVGDDVPDDEIEARLLDMVGDTVADDGFLSTTSSTKVGLDFVANRREGNAIESTDTPGVVMRVQVPQSSKGGVWIEGKFDENEVLYAQGTGLKITGVSRYDDPKEELGRSTVFVVDAEMDIPADSDAPVRIVGDTGYGEEYVQGLREELGEVNAPDVQETVEGIGQTGVANKPITVFSSMSADDLVGSEDGLPAFEKLGTSEQMRRLIGEEVGLDKLPGLSADPGDVIGDDDGKIVDRYSPGGVNAVVSVNVPEGMEGLSVDESGNVVLPEGSTLVARQVRGVRTPPEEKFGESYYRDKFYHVEIDVVPKGTQPGQELPRTADDVAADIATAIEAPELPSLRRAEDADIGGPVNEETIIKHVGKGQTKSNVKEAIGNDADRALQLVGETFTYRSEEHEIEEPRDIFLNYAEHTFGDEINGLLRSGAELDEDYAQHVAGMDAVIDATSASEPFTVFRGASAGALVPEARTMSEADLEEQLLALVGTTVADGGYLSTSFDPASAVRTFARPGRTAQRDYDYGFIESGEERRPVIMRIAAPEGAKAFSVRDNPVEQEVLFGRNTEMRVANVSAVRYPGTDTPTTYIVDMEIVPDTDVTPGGQELSRSASEVSGDITAVLDSIGDTLTKRIEQSILGE